MQPKVFALDKSVAFQVPLSHLPSSREGEWPQTFLVQCYRGYASKGLQEVLARWNAPCVACVTGQYGKSMGENSHTALLSAVVKYGSQNLKFIAIASSSSAVHDTETCFMALLFDVC